jgi:chromosome segregation ATPase
MPEDQDRSLRLGQVLQDVVLQSRTSQVRQMQLIEDVKELSVNVSHMRNTISKLQQAVSNHKQTLRDQQKNIDSIRTDLVKVCEKLETINLSVTILNEKRPDCDIRFQKIIQNVVILRNKLSQLGQNGELIHTELESIHKELDKLQVSVNALTKQKTKVDVILEFIVRSWKVVAFVLSVLGAVLGILAYLK